MTSFSILIRQLSSWFLLSVCWWGGPPLVAAVVANPFSAVPLRIRYDCEPCIDRSNRVVRLILHGGRDDPFWQQAAEAIWQTAQALRVTLQFELYEQVDLRQMASDIRAVAFLVMQQQELEEAEELQREQNSKPAATRDASSDLVPDVLIVTLPSQEVEEAVAEVVATGLPVFGMNSGYDRAADLGLQAFVGMDEYQAGVEAGKQFDKLRMEHNVPLRRVLFVNHQRGNSALQQRKRGLEEFLRQAVLTAAPTVAPTVMLEPDGNETVATITTTTQTSATPPLFSTIRRARVVWEALVDGPNDPNALRTLQSFLTRQDFEIEEGECPYQAVMLSESILDVTLEALEASCPNATLFTGSFDTSTRMYQALAVGQVDFTISQQHWLQSSLATLLASIFATNGMRLQLSSETEFGTYLSGPQVITIRNLPTDTLQICETEGYPICRQLSGGGAESKSAAVILENGFTEGGCLCFDRPSLRLAAVFHGVDTDPFWWVIRDAAQQAALDMNIQLEVELFPPAEDTNVLHSKLASKIISLCQQGIDGLIVSIPSNKFVPALRQCQSLNVPMIAVNAGGDIAAEENLLHYVGQDEEVAAEVVGQSLLNAGARRGICLNHAPELDFVVQRCRFFQKAITDQYGPDAYLGMVSVGPDNVQLTLDRAERAVEVATGVRGGDWENLAILVPGSVLLEPLLQLLERHPEALGATYDSDPQITEAVSSGKIKFGIDQQTYLQGYVPVVLLTWFAQTTQALANQNIASGPKFVVEAPSEAERQCRDTFFSVCPPPLDVELNQLGKVRIFGYLLAVSSVLTAILFALYVACCRKSPIIQRSQPFFLLMVCGGSALMGSTIFALAVDDRNSSQKFCDAACMTAPWLFTIGFTVVFAALYSKLVRLNTLLKHAARFRRIQVKPKDVMMPFFVLLTLNVAMLTTWTFADPMYWKRAYISEVESYGVCRLGDTAVSIAMALGIFFLNVVALLLALIEAFKSRKVSYEFSESGSIAIVVASILQVAIVGVPILPLVRDDPPASFLLKSGLVFVVSMSTSLFIFIPKLRRRSGPVWESIRAMRGPGHGSSTSIGEPDRQHERNMNWSLTRQNSAPQGGLSSSMQSQSAARPQFNASSSLTGLRSSGSTMQPVTMDNSSLQLVTISEVDAESGTTRQDDKLLQRRQRPGRPNGDKDASFNEEQSRELKEQRPATQSLVAGETLMVDPVCFLKQLAERVHTGEISQADVLKAIGLGGIVSNPSETGNAEDDETLNLIDSERKECHPRVEEAEIEKASDAHEHGSASSESSVDDLAKQLGDFIHKTSSLLREDEIEHSFQDHNSDEEELGWDANTSS